MFFLVPRDDADLTFDLSEGLYEQVVVVPGEVVKYDRNLFRSSQSKIARSVCCTTILSGVVAVIANDLLLKVVHEAKFFPADPTFLRFSEVDPVPVVNLIAFDSVNFIHRSSTVSRNDFQK